MVGQYLSSAKYLICNNLSICVLIDTFILPVFCLDESSSQLGRGRRKKTATHKVTELPDVTEGSVSENADSDKLVYKVNQEGRYICQLCEKTFKTVSRVFNICVCVFH